MATESELKDLLLVPSETLYVPLRGISYKTLQDEVSTSYRPMFPDGGELIAEQTGYIPMSLKLAEMQAAGAKQQAYESGLFDFPDLESLPESLSDVELPSSRIKGKTVFDAIDEMHSLEEKYLAYRKAVEDLKRQNSEEAMRKRIQDEWNQLHPEAQSTPAPESESSK